MLRMLPVALLALCWVVVAQSDEGKPKTEPKPQWQRLLSGDDSHKAAGLAKRIAELEAADKYTEAIRLREELLALRTQVQGADHWQTMDEKWALATAKKVAALPEEKRTGWRQAEMGAEEARRLEEKALYGKALPRKLERLKWCQEILGEENPYTANSYHNVTYNLQAQGKYAEAAPLFQKALDIRRTILGEEDPDTAQSYNNFAYNLQAQGKYAEAAPLFQKSLDIRRKRLGEEHPDTAQSYNTVATNLTAQGKYGYALPLYWKALSINRKVLGEEHVETAIGYNNIAHTLQAQMRYAEARPLYHRALAIRRKLLGEDHPDTATSYNNLAYNLQVQKNHVEALTTWEAAARAYEAARVSVAARGLDRAAFGAKQSPYLFLAAARLRAGQTERAWAALEADLARGFLDDVSRGFGSEPGEYGAVEQLSLLQAHILALRKRPKRTDAEAVELERLLSQLEQLKKAMAKLAARHSLHQVAPLRRLQAVLAADSAFVFWLDIENGGDVQEHWGCIVRPKGEPHWECLPGSGPGGKWTTEDTTLPARFYTALAQGTLYGEVASLATKLYSQRLAPLTKQLDGVKHVFVAPVHRMASVPLEALTDQYTISYISSGTILTLLKEQHSNRPRSKGLLAVGDPVFRPIRDTPQPTALPPGGLLITQVLPDGTAAQARLQSGDVLVAYAGENLTSVGQLGNLITAKSSEKSVVAKVWREREDKLAERELAPGRLGVALAREPAREAITARRQADHTLAKLSRGETFAELPGTQVEIARLAEMFDAKSVTTLTRDKASEQRLDELRRAGKLQQFRYLHFATHGKTNNVRAFDSALILTPPARPPEVRAGEPYLEGQLTAAEVLEYWKLDAELVTLSACESGLGREGGGDGLLGFAQAFLMAGSRSVCLTLWQVDDTATALLMDRFYRNLLGKRDDQAKPMSKAAALREAKQWLRNLPAEEALERLGVLTKGVVRGERPAREEMKAVPKPKDAAKDYKPYAHPRYWASFILVGDPE
jgi:CHAT domain-containing protein